eukprot:12997561-Alexandrium_andersonii.AAC.1
MNTQKTLTEILEAASSGSTSDTWRRGMSKSQSDMSELFWDVFGASAEISDEETDGNQGESVAPG